MVDNALRLPVLAVLNLILWQKLIVYSRFFALVAFLLPIFSFVGCTAELASKPIQIDLIKSAIENEVRDVLERRSLPGLSVAVLHRGELIFAQGFGWADIEAGIPVQPQTLFPIGSIEKQFTAAAIMRLVEQGQVGLDDPISFHIPRLDTDGKKVTIRQMLNQVSGLQGTGTLSARRRASKIPDPPSEQWGPVPDISVGKGFDSTDIGLFQGQPLYYQPGERFSYSQPNYDLLCFVIADLFGESYYDVIDELANSAGLRSFHAAWSPRPSDASPLVADGYSRTKDGVTKVWEENLGSAWATATDLVRWARELAHGKVVSPKSFKEMSSHSQLNDGRRWPYGFGLGIESWEGRRKLIHSGDVHGFYAGLSYYPDEDLAIAFMTNVELGWFMQDLEPRIARAVLGIPQPVGVDVPIEADQLEKYLGSYDAGTLWIDVIAEGDGVYVILKEPEYVEEGFQLLRDQLFYQGHGRFVAKGSPDWLYVSFDCDRDPSEVVVHWDGAPIQGIRKTP